MKTKAEVQYGYNPVDMLKKFLNWEAAGGVILVAFAIMAMIIANTSWGHVYEHVLYHVHIFIGITEVFTLDKHVIHWINDGLMAIFFFLVGLEIKREMMEGNLSSFSQASLPLFAAIGGMAVPGLIFYALNAGDATAAKGWAIPAATDIAFAIGLLVLLGKRIPLSLKVFLLAVAIFDDLGAIVIIAVFYTEQLNTGILPWAALFIGMLAMLNALQVNKGTFYIIIGIALWFCVLKSGIHATLAGVITALAIPLETKRDSRSLLRQLEHDLHPAVAFIILPIFAFANAGVSLEGMTPSLLLDNVTLGVILGLFLGKQLGIFGFVYIAIKLGMAKLPHGLGWGHIWGVSMMAGIGFTMSMFIATLGFKGAPIFLAEAKLGILIGSLLSAVGGIVILLNVCKKNADQSHDT